MNLEGSGFRLMFTKCIIMGNKSLHVILLIRELGGIDLEIVVVSEYDPEWINEYEQEKVKIRRVLSDVLLRIEHIGSTSIPKLGSKPIIDMMVGVADIQQVSEVYITGLEGIGYEYVFKPDFPERRFFRRGEWRAGTHHLHIYEYESENWMNNILFRDYLKNDSSMMEEYYFLKKKLEQQHKHDRVAYTDGKSDFIGMVIEMAKKVKEREDGQKSQQGGVE